MPEARDVSIQGYCAPGFERVRDAFERNFSERAETGAAVALYVDGRPVVDLWGGAAHPPESGPGAAPAAAWQQDTLVHLYSVTKPLAALALLALVDRGAVELDAPVARYWPEFAQAGKEGVTLRWLLSHQAGLLGLRAPQPPEAIYDWERMTALLAAEAPWWPPGTRHGEHAFFYGHLVGEVVRRVSGMGLGAFLRAEITGPWQLDFHVGLKDEEMARCATVGGMTPAWRAGLDAAYGPLFAQALDNPPGRLNAEVVNGAAWRRAEIPAVNGHATARAVARLYGGLACGGVLEGTRFISAGLLDEALRDQSVGQDVFLGRHVRWGLGFQLDEDGFGHGGLGGALGWGNRQFRFGFGYVTNFMAEHDRASAVYAAVAETLGFEIPEE
jgi:CubicO group peptidase (beta-lactamase class C family)